MNLALQGHCILLTRSLTQSKKTAAEIQSHGGESLVLACMECVVLSAEIQRGWHLLQKKSPAWVLFTSVNALESLESTLGSNFVLELKRHTVLAVGEKTADFLHEAGIKHVLVPQEHSQEGLLSMMLALTLPKQLFFFRAEKARNFLQQSLIEQGVEVFAVMSYQMQCPQSDATTVLSALKEGQVDAVLLGSPQTVRHYLRRTIDIRIANNALLVAISPRVAETATSLGLKVSLVSKEANFSSMLMSLHHYFEGK
ncbi:MAG: uroporphyrinogen-III synthase [Mariprofundaceae bacterium]|nr:uroporphyrinogen-III synthase [Mariprofundaceae bacterium]